MIWHSPSTVGGEEADILVSEVLIGELMSGLGSPTLLSRMSCPPGMGERRVIKRGWKKRLTDSTSLFCHQHHRYRHADRNINLHTTGASNLPCDSHVSEEDGNSLIWAQELTPCLGDQHCLRSISHPHLTSVWRDKPMSAGIRPHPSFLPGRLPLLRRIGIWNFSPPLMTSANRKDSVGFISKALFSFPSSSWSPVLWFPRLLTTSSCADHFGIANLPTITLCRAFW